MLQNHLFKVCQVLQCLQKIDLQVNKDKCKFHIQVTKFCGLIISTEDIQIDQHNVITIFKWALLTFFHHIRLFLCF